MQSNEKSLVAQNNTQFQNALSKAARSLLNDPLSQSTKKRQARLLAASAVTWAASLSAVRITNFKMPVIDITVSIAGKSMGIVVAVITAYLLLSFAVQATLELKTRSFLTDQFFMRWQELFDANSSTVRQCLVLDDEMREIWAQEEPILTHYRVNHHYLSERLSRLMRKVPRLTEPRSAGEAAQFVHVVLPYCQELHRTFVALRCLEEDEEKRLQSSDVIARKARFAELSELKREVLRDDTVCVRLQRILSVMRTASDYLSSRGLVEVAIPVAFGTLSIVLFIVRL
jgi:hypothetical protein